MTSHSPPRPRTSEFSVQKNLSCLLIIEGPEGHRGQGVEEVDDALVTTLEPGTDLQTCWISQLPTGFKKTPPLPLVAGGGTAHLNSSCVEASTAALGKRENAGRQEPVGGVSLGLTGSGLTHLSLLWTACDAVSWPHSPPSDGKCDTLAR